MRARPGHSTQVLVTSEFIQIQQEEVTPSTLSFRGEGPPGRRP